MGEAIIALINRLREANKNLTEEAEDCAQALHDNRLMRERIATLSEEIERLKRGGGARLTL